MSKNVTYIATDSLSGEVVYLLSDLEAYFDNNIDFRSPELVEEEVELSKRISSVLEKILRV